MNLEQPFLESIRESPGEASLWLILADWLEERDDPRAELVRLTLSLRTEPDQGDFDKRQRRVQELLGGGMKPLVPTLVNSIGMTFALIPAGSFLMGSPESEEGRSANEWRHRVTLSRPFYLGVFPVTQAQYQAVTTRNPSHFQGQYGGGPDNPVETVPWDDAVAFCGRLSGLPAEHAAGRVYRLPTEAQWEYACRAGTTTPFHFGAVISARHANFYSPEPYGGEPPEPALKRTTPVGSYPPNAWGLYDMHGNVVNWCQDWYSREVAEGIDPVGPEEPGEGLPYRCVRGGAWCFHGQYCRAAHRNHATIGPGNRREFYSFRVLCEIR
jgi:uncharacterized protein (TIGR02996 family)